MKKLSLGIQHTKLIITTVIVFSILIMHTGVQMAFAQSTENSTIYTKTTCIYQGSEYSAGSVVTMPGGSKTCHSSGVWV